MTVLRLGAAAAVTGILVAAVLAAAIPRTETSQATTGRAVDPTAAAPAPAGDPRRPRLAPARPQPTGAGWVSVRARGPIRIEARRPDPRGGPPWAVRVFLAERTAAGRVIGRPRCAQLGRIHRGRFGWIDATNTFRPVGTGVRGAPSWCGTTTADMRREPHVEVLTRITDPTAGAAAPIQTVVWGLAGADGRVRLTAAGRPRPVPRTPNGAFLAILPATPGEPDVRTAVTYPTGRPVRRDHSFRASAERANAEFGSLGRPGRPLPEPALPIAGRRPAIELRLPDPNGGLPYGMTAAPAENGGWCRSELNRIVGDRVGAVDYELGTFEDSGPDLNGGCPARGSEPTPGRPLAFGYSGGGGFAGDLGQDPQTGRTARRTLPGLTTVYGTAHPAVRTITAASPRDVRTIRPSRRAHAFALVYDGSFPTGELTLTATFDDGRTHSETITFAF